MKHLSIIAMKMMSWIVMLLMCSYAANSNADQLRSKNAWSHDNAEVDQQWHLIGYLKALKKTKSSLGVDLGAWKISENNQQEKFNILGVNASVIDKINGTLEVELMLYDNKDWSTELFSVRYSVLTNALYYYEVAAERSIVDSIQAINNRVMVDTYSASFDVPVTAQTTFVAAAIYQSFTDDNSKQGGIIKGVYSFDAIKGMNASIVMKQLNADRRGSGYFSPDKQLQYYATVDYSVPVFDEKFKFKSSISLGREIINDDIYNHLAKIELGFKGWLDDVNGLEGRVGCSNTADTQSNRSQNQYRYCYATLNYKYAF